MLKKKAKKEAPADTEAEAEDAGDDAEADGGGEDAGAGAPPPKKGGLMKKLLMFGLPAVIVLLGGAGAAIMFLGGESETAAHGGEHVAEGGDGHQEMAEAEPFFFYEMPELLVNINGGNGKTSFLKLKLNIEVTEEELLPVLDESMPRVIDRYQGFLRELRPEDLSGSAGYYRLKLELLRRVNLAIAPAEAEAVNIDQMLIQ